MLYYIIVEQERYLAKMLVLYFFLPLYVYSKAQNFNLYYKNINTR